MARVPIGSLTNVPNSISLVRFALAVAVVVLVPAGYFTAATVVFLAAACTDWVDGYWARRYGQVTKIGRILDPFVDKVLVCGAFITLVGVPGSPVAAWVAVVVVARELLVSSLRGIIEGGGGDFSASQAGKWKMVLQCVAVVAALVWVDDVAAVGSVAAWLRWVTWGSIAAAVWLTIQSGVEYVVAAAKVLAGPTAPSLDRP